jgi:DNA-binding LacI/PurR family transcriptional regulator
VLNDVAGAIPVSEATRRRVRTIAEELDYQPHPFARALRGAPTTLLGAVVRDIADPRALSEPPSAIVAATDLLALGLIHAANEVSVAVPSELSIIGFDDIPLAAAAVPGLTTVRTPVEKIVAAGVALAVGERARDNGGPLLDPPRLVFKPQLIVRASTSPA